jgi:peptide/nickel transport system ATP-binding protein
MEAGSIVESGPAQDVLNYPRSPYTKRLLEAASLAPEGNRSREGQEVQGQPVEGVRVPEHEVHGGRIPGSREVLSLNHVSKDFAAKKRANKRGNQPALSDISLGLGQGEILGVLGQSGSGKSTLARSIIGLENIDSGRISLDLQDHDVRGDGDREGRRAGQHSPVQLVFQEPHDSFDPRMRLQTSLEAPLLRRKDLSKDERSARILQAIEEVGLDPVLLDRLPGQCSGGQLQRLTIARALLLEPSILICDEATSALDALTQRMVLNLLLRLHRDKGLSLVLISHDMDVIRYMSDRVAVLFKGRLVEVAETGEFFTRPQHEHSQALVSAALPVCELLSRSVRPSPLTKFIPAEVILSSPNSYSVSRQPS